MERQKIKILVLLGIRFAGTEHILEITPFLKKERTLTPRVIWETHKLMYHCVAWCSHYKIKNPGKETLQKSKK